MIHVFGDPDVLAWEATLKNQRAEHPSYAQVETNFVAGGHRFETENDAVETAGVLVANLTSFERTKLQWHWGPFYADTSARGVVDLVHGQVMSDEERPYEGELWHAFDCYRLRSLFAYHDLGLDAGGEVVAVRSRSHEDLFWSEGPGQPAEHTRVAAEVFDEALAAFIGWLEVLVGA